MKIYIAGPITLDPNAREKFSKAEEMLKHYGHTVLNPMKNEGFSYREYIDMGLAELSKCDAIYMLNGWACSRGAVVEYVYANIVGLKVLSEDMFIH